MLKVIEMLFICIKVFVKDKPRISISGWFHGATPPPGYNIYVLYIL